MKTASAVVFGWLVPGGGYLLERRWGRGAIFAGLVVASVAAGLALGGNLAWPRPEELQGVDGFTALMLRLGAGAKLLAGFPALLAAGGSRTFLEGRVHEYGSTLLGLAGVFNVLAVADALETEKEAR